MEQIVDTAEMKVYELAELRMEQALVSLADEGKLPASSKDIKGWVEQHHPKDFVRLERSWPQNLFRAASNPATRIKKRPNSYAYELGEAEAETAAEQAATPEPESKTASDDRVVADEETGDNKPLAERGKTQREEKLYPVLLAWLRAQQLQAQDTSQTKTGGRWGNPDLTGLKIVEGHLGQRFLEVVTIEAKTAGDKWKEEFFEAVSHKRFANRAYFAFGYGSDEPSLERIPFSDRQELRRYGEKYRVGVLVVFIPSDTYEKLRTSPTPPELPPDEVRIEELWPALHDTPDAHTVHAHLRGVLELTSDNKLWNFGREQDD